MRISVGGGTRVFHSDRTYAYDEITNWCAVLLETSPTYRNRLAAIHIEFDGDSFGKGDQSCEIPIADQVDMIAERTLKQWGATVHSQSQ